MRSQKTLILTLKLLNHSDESQPSDPVIVHKQQTCVAIHSWGKEQGDLSHPHPNLQFSLHSPRFFYLPLSSSLLLHCKEAASIQFLATMAAHQITSIMASSLLPSFVFCRLPSSSSSSSRLFTIHTAATPSFNSGRFGCELRLQVHAVSCAVAVVPRRRSETWQQPQAAGGLEKAELIQHSSSSRGSLSLSRTSSSSFRFALLPVCFFFPKQRVEKIEILLFLRTASFMSSEHSWNRKHLLGARQLGRVCLRQ